MKLWCKKLTLKIGIMITFLPISAIISCSQKELLKLSPHVYLIDKNIQDNPSRKHIDLSSLERKNIKKIPPNWLGYYNTKMISGGWAEYRKFYKNSPLSLHTGIDVMLKAKTKIIAPTNAQVVASYWYQQGNVEFAEGIGGISILKIKIDDLDIEKKLKEFIYINQRNKIYKVPKFVFSENGIFKEPNNITTKDEYKKWLKKLDTLDIKKKPYLNENHKKQKWIEDSKIIYVGIMHLSEKGIGKWSNSNIATYNYNDKISSTLKVDKTIDYKNPRNLLKGDILGLTGEIQDNGGWSPHVHVNTYYNVSSLFTRLRNYSLADKNDKNEVKKTVFFSKCHRGYETKEHRIKNSKRKIFMRQRLL